MMLNPTTDHLEILPENLIQAEGQFCCATEEEAEILKQVKLQRSSRVKGAGREAEICMGSH